MDGKVRVYQTQSRLIGLHAACVLAVARITGNVVPAFKVSNTGNGERAKRLAKCEWCSFNALPNSQLMAHIRVVSAALKGRIDDRILMQGQYELLEAVRASRALALVEGRDDEPAVEEGQLKQRPPRPHAPEDHNTLEGWAKLIMPPKREYAPTTARKTLAAGKQDKSAGDDGSGGLEAVRRTIRGNRQGPLDPAETETLFVFAEAEAIGRRRVLPSVALNNGKQSGECVVTQMKDGRTKVATMRPREGVVALPDELFEDVSERDEETGVVTRLALNSKKPPFKFNVVGATGEGRSAKLPDKKTPPKFRPYKEGDYLALARGIMGPRVEVSEPLPDKASVNWLRVERDVLRRQLADGTITMPGRVRLQDIREALKARNVTEEEAL